MFGFGKSGDRPGGQGQGQRRSTGSGFGVPGNGSTDPSSPAVSPAPPSAAFGSQAGFGINSSGAFGASTAFAAAVTSTAGGAGRGSNVGSIFGSGGGFGNPGSALTRQSSGGGNTGGLGSGATSGNNGGGLGSSSTKVEGTRVSGASTGANSDLFGMPKFGTGGGFGGGGAGGGSNFVRLSSHASSNPPTFAAIVAKKPSAATTGFGAGGGFGIRGGFGSGKGSGPSGGFGGGTASVSSGAPSAMGAGGTSNGGAWSKSSSATVAAPSQSSTNIGTSGGFGSGGFGANGTGRASETWTATRKKGSTGASNVSRLGFGGTGAWRSADQGATATAVGFATPAVGSHAVGNTSSFADAAKRALGSQSAWRGGAGTPAVVTGGEKSTNSGFGITSTSPVDTTPAAAGYGFGGASNSSIPSRVGGGAFGAPSASDSAAAPFTNAGATASSGAVFRKEVNSRSGHTSSVKSPDRNDSGKSGARPRSGALDSQASLGVGSDRTKRPTEADGGATFPGARTGKTGQGGASTKSARRRRRGADEAVGDDGGRAKSKAGGKNPTPRREKDAPITRLGLSAADAAAMAASVAPAPAFIGGGGSGGKRRSGGEQSKSPTKARSAIVGGLGPRPPGASSSSPAFIDGGSDAGGTRSGFGAAAGADAADDMEAKARRAQRFSAAGGVSGFPGGGGGLPNSGDVDRKSRGGGRAESSGVGIGGGGEGGGSAEDVQRGSHLDDAEIKIGTVEAMCPLEERLRRVPGDLHILEKEHPSLMKFGSGDGTPPQPWEHVDLVVKRHQRAAAGMDISKPELLRTPPWLARTVDHLVMNCVDKGPHGGGDPAAAWDDPRVKDHMAKFRANNPSRAHLAEDETEQDLYNFVWDRFRMVRSDYNMQGYNPVVGLVSESSVVAHERMARWYVLMHNRMSKNTVQTHRFNLKSIVETLKKLYEFYTIVVARGQTSKGVASPNEPEIMAYYVLTVMQQDDGVEVQRLVKDMIRNRREEVLKSPEIKGALRVVQALRSGDYVAFFRAFREQGVMHRCLMAQYVGSMRTTAIKTIAKCYVDMSVEEVMRLLCFENIGQTIDFLAAYKIDVDNDGQVILRARNPRTNRLSIKFQTPDEPPETPPLQDLVEPKPWRLASEWVFKGDRQPAWRKSHTAETAQDITTDSAASLIRATSTSSASSSAVRGRQGSKTTGIALSVAPKSLARVPSSSSARAGLVSSSTMPTRDVSPSAVPLSPRASDRSSIAAKGKPAFGGSETGFPSKANSFKFPLPANPSGQQYVQPQAGKPSSAMGAAFFGSVGTGAGLSSKAAPAPSATSAPSHTAATSTSTSGRGGGGGATPPSTRDPAGRPSSITPRDGAMSRSPAAPTTVMPTPASAMSPSRASGPTTRQNTAAREAAAAAATARQAAEKAAKDRARVEADAKKEAQSRATALAAMQAAAAAAAEEKRRIADAERHARHALSKNLYVGSDVFKKLPPDSTLRKRAQQARNARGMRFGSSLLKGWTAVADREHRAAWDFWVAEARRWLQTEQVIQHHNQQYEDHDALAGKSLWLRRRRPRTLPGRKGNAIKPVEGRNEGRKVGPPTVAAARRKDVQKVTVLRKPQSLDLPSILGPAVAKNQGMDAAAAFRAAGLTRRNGEGTGKDDALSLPHLFWKAVLIIPSCSGTNVGAWLESKLGDGGRGAAGGYESDVRESQLTCSEVATSAPVVKERQDVSLGSSTRSRLINLSLREVPGHTSTPKATKTHFPRWMHLCVQRMDVDAGKRLENSPQLSAKLDAASVVVFAACPKDDRRYFLSPFQPKPDWTEARENLRRVLDAASPRDARALPALGVPVLVVIPVRDSVLSPNHGNTTSPATVSSGVRQRILRDAYEGLALGDLAKRGFSFRAMVVGLHEFESRSRAAAAAGEGLVFEGKLEDACSRELGEKLAALSGQAPLQPLVATRSLTEMLKTAVSRVTTDNRYAAAAGLKLPTSKYEDPPLDAVVEAATRATAHVLKLLCRKAENWPIREFAIATRQEQQCAGGQELSLTYVLGAARPTGGELTPSSFYPEAQGEIHNDRLRNLVFSNAGLPLDWAAAPSSNISPAATELIRAATLPVPVPSDLVETFSDGVLLAKAGAGARVLGQQEAWARVERLEEYLGRGVLSGDLKFRMAESLAGGVMMRGSPPPWRMLVRDAVEKRLRSTAGPDGTRPFVVHFVAASGEQRLADGGLMPGLMAAENKDVMAYDSKESARDERLSTPVHEPLPAQGDVPQKATAALKRVAPIMAEVQEQREKQRRLSSSTSRAGSRGRGTNKSKRKRGGGTDTALISSSGIQSDSDRRRQDTIDRLRHEAEELRALTERERERAQAELAVDIAVLKSYGLTMTGVSSSSSLPDGNAAGTAHSRRRNESRTDEVSQPPDTARLSLSRPLFREAMRQAGGGGGKVPTLEDAAYDTKTLEAHRYENIRRNAEATLSAADYRCWIIREEVLKDRQEQERLWAKVFNGDPLVVPPPGDGLWTG